VKALSKRKEEKGKITVEEAGKRGGEATSESHGSEFYSDIGHKGGAKGGPRVKELIEEGKEHEQE
jgi:general stress protein YciG